MTQPDIPFRTPPLAIAAFALATTFYFLGFAHRVAPAVMTEELMREFAVGAALLGNLSAFYFYSYALLQIPVGVMLDRVGPRRLLSAAAAAMAAGSVLFAAAGFVEAAYLGRLLVGAGAAFTFVGVLTVAAQWFPARRFAGLIGIAQAAGMAGAIAGTWGLGPLVAEIGWRLPMTVAGVVGAGVAAGLWLAVRDRQTEAPAEAAGLMDGLRAVARNRQTWLCALFGFSIVAPILTFAGLWAVPWLEAAYGLGRAKAAELIAVMFVGWGVGSPLVGALSDRLGRRRPVMIAFSAAAAVLLVPILFVTTLPVPWLYPLYFLYGMAGCTMFLSFVCTREHNPAFATGAALGINNTAVMAGGAVFQPLIGLLLDLQWDGATVAGAPVYAVDMYRTAFVALMASALTAVAAALLLREPPRRG